MSRRVAVIGGGGHAKVVLATLQSQGVEVAGIFDDSSDLWGKRIHGCEVLGPISVAPKHVSAGVIAVGSNEERRRLARDVPLEWVTSVHSSAWVHPSVELGPGTVVFAGAVIQPDTILAEHVIVNTGAKIDHDCQIGAFAHIAPGVSLAGNVVVGEGVLMGIGSTAIPGVRIGDRGIVGAGAAVVGDIEPGATVVGVPAKIVKRTRG